MKKQKLTISFVNKGDPFEVPNWTVERHESALSKLAKEQQEKKWNDKKASEEFKYYVIYETLSEIDESGMCTLEKIRNMHTNNVVELFNIIYLAGKENIYFREGQKTQNNKKPSSIGKKN